MLKINFLFVILLWFCAPNFYSQSYSEYIATAYSDYLKKDYRNSLNYYNKAFEIKVGFASDYYNASCSAALALQKQKSIELLNKAVEEGYEDFDHLLKDADLNLLKSDSSWQVIIRILKEKKQNLQNNYDKPLKDSLEEILKLDQLHRGEYIGLLKTPKQDTSQLKALGQKILKIDSVNVIKITSILDHHGWPSHNKVGIKACTSVFIILQHADLVTQKKYLSLVKKAVQTNDATPSYLALLLDRIELREGRKQIYGTQYKFDDKTRQRIMEPVIDPENLNKRRLSMGLSELKQ